MPPWWCEHAAVWHRRSDGLSVDLHRTLIGVAVDDATAWRLLSADTEEVVVAGHPVRALGTAGEGDARRLARRAARLELVDSDLRTWSGLSPPRAMICGDAPRHWQRSCGRRRRSSRACGSACRRAARRPSGAARRPLGRGRAPQRLAAAAGARLRAAGAGARVSGAITRSPAASSCQRPRSCATRDPDAATGRVGLARAYVRRAAWLLRRAPAGLLAWYRARRSVR